MRVGITGTLKIKRGSPRARCQTLWSESQGGLRASRRTDIQRSRRDDGETDVAMVFRRARVVRSRVLHAPAGPGQGESRAEVAWIQLMSRTHA